MKTYHYHEYDVHPNASWATTHYACVVCGLAIPRHSLGSALAEGATLAASAARSATAIARQPDLETSPKQERKSEMEPVQKTNQQATALIAITRAILDAVEAGSLGAPGGTIYTALMMAGCSLEQYEYIMSAMVGSGLLTRSGHLYRTTDRGRTWGRS